MNTRSKTKAAKQNNIAMADDAQTTLQTTNNVDEVDDETINNQLGIAGIFDNMTQVDFGQSTRREEAPVAEAEKEQQSNPDVSETGAQGPVQPTPECSLNQLLLALTTQMQQMEERQNQRMETQNQRLREDIQTQGRQMKESICTLKRDLKEELRTCREENVKMHEETRAKLQKTEGELRTEMHQVQGELQAEISAVKEEGAKTQEKLKENNEIMKGLKGEITKNRQQIVINTKNLSENLNRINSELRDEIKLTSEETSRVKKTQEEMEEQMKRLAEVKKKRIDEIKESQEQLTRRMNDVERGPIHRVVTANDHRELTFDGVDCYPMEFLKELREIKQQYYNQDDIRWIGRHLTNEATVWWRIVKPEVSTFAEFEERFIDKFWGAHIQESVRDRLEFSRFNPRGDVNPVQFMQKHILQCRQLVPPISDQHMIKKLARMFGRDIQVAVLARGVKEIPQFEALLQEYMKITEYGTDRQRYANTDVKKENGEFQRPHEQRENGAKHGNYHHKGNKKHTQRYVEMTEEVAGPSGTQTKNGGAKNRPQASQ